MSHPDQAVQYLQYSSAGWEMIDARVIGESPVSLTVNGSIWLTFMCTPTHLEALAVGFLFNEGIIETAAEIASVRVCGQGNNVDVWMLRDVRKPAQWRRTSGCAGGVTGESAQDTIQPVPVSAPLNPDLLLAGMDQLFKSQQLYRETRGVHCSALSDGEQILLEAEDIGRHNTLDKLAGRLLLEQVTPRRRVIFTTGRISSEMLQKSARLRAEVIVSRTSPTALSIDLARQYGITLVGYARRNQFNVYAHPERLLNGSLPLPVTLRRDELVG